MFGNKRVNRLPTLIKNSNKSVGHVSARLTCTGLIKYLFYTDVLSVSIQIQLNVTFAIVVDFKLYSER